MLRLAERRTEMSIDKEESFTFIAALDHDLKIKFKPFLVFSGNGGRAGLTLTLVLDAALRRRATVSSNEAARRG